jgi:ribonuclease J
MAEAPEVRVIPLGGASEIGKNMAVVECEGAILVIDAGLEFPDEETPGIELILPDWTYLLQNRDRLVGLILTHGHEDHIGALPFLLRDLQVPLYGTRLTLGLVEAKLAEYPTVQLPRIHEVRAGEQHQIGPFRVDFIHVNHSIPDTVALGIHTPVGILVWTSDFKFDHTPLDGQVTDFGHLAHLGDQGVWALLTDTTNATRPGATPSERVVAETFHRLFPQAARRIIISTFASNIHRIQQVFNVAADFGRKVWVDGRSMERCVRIASALGYLDIPPQTQIELEALPRLRDDEVVILTTGSQGEPLSALVRMSQGEHRHLQIQPGDMVIMSATPIPGNEATVWRTVNRLFRRGAEVIYPPLAQVHVSGHGNREELEMMLNLVRPRYVVPLHGEPRHLDAYIKMAQDMGLPRQHVFPLENGDVLAFSKAGAALQGSVPAGSLMVDGSRVVSVQETVLRERQRLAAGGVMVVTAALDSCRGELIAGPTITPCGFVFRNAEEEKELLEAGRRRVQEAFLRLTLEERRCPERVEINMRNTLGRFIAARTHCRPVIVPVVQTVAPPPEDGTSGL